MYNHIFNPNRDSRKKGKSFPHFIFLLCISPLRQRPILISSSIHLIFKKIVELNESAPPSMLSCSLHVGNSWRWFVVKSALTEIDLSTTVQISGGENVRQWNVRSVISAQHPPVVSLLLLHLLNLLHLLHFWWKRRDQNSEIRSILNLNNEYLIKT